MSATEQNLDIAASGRRPDATPEKNPFLITANTNNSGISIQTESVLPTPKVSVARRAGQPRPLLGLLALLIAACCALFSLAILVTSNNKPTAQWKVQPTVYLAVASAVANSAIGFAYAQAAMVAWWYRASKGASISALEHQWEASFSLVYAVLPRKKIGLQARMATILVALIAVDGPLLQKASSVVLGTHTRPVQLDFTLAPEVPTGFSGTTWNGMLHVRAAADGVLNDWVAGSAMSLPTVPVCEGACIGKVIGPGLATTNCTTTTWPISVSMFNDPNATWGSGDSSDFYYTAALTNDTPTHPYFYIQVLNQGPPKEASSGSKYPESAELSVGSISLGNDDSGNYTETKCFLRPAILEYNVEFDATNHASIQYDAGSAGTLVALANNTQAWNFSKTDSVHRPVTMNYFVMQIGPTVFVNTRSSSFLPGFGWGPDSQTENAQTMKYQQNLPDIFYYSDPTTDIIRSFNEVLFRAAIATSTWSNLTQLVDPGLVSANRSISTNQTITANVYHSDFRWYAGATVLELVVALAVLPLFWGYWSLRKVLKLSPFNIALAFNAPLLGGADPSKGASGVVKQLGDMQVRFGVVEEKISSPASPGGIERITRVGFGESRDVLPL